MTIKINGIDCAFEEGEYILNIARRNDILSQQFAIFQVVARLWLVVCVW
ncbi:NADH-ubiquinone oxidoreductase chain G [Campylobacter coli]|nr:NADH-ubiquinone oxidoreductase chain G [Campylobacter coli]